MPPSQDPYRLAQQQQAAAARLVAQQAKQTAQEQEAAAKAARNAELSRQELEYRAQGMIPVTTADGNLHPDPLWDQKQAEKAAKEQEAAAKAAQQQQAAQISDQFTKEGRKFFTSKVTGMPVALESDAQLEQQRKDRAEQARKAALDERLRAIETATTDPAKRRLPTKARDNLAKQVKTAKQEALFALQSSLQEQAKATDKAGWYDVVNNNPTPEALTAQERLSRLSQPDADLTDQDLADLEANDATKPLAAKIRNASAILTKDDEAAQFHEQQADTAFDLKLRRDDPAAWAERQRQRRASMSPQELQADLEASTADLATRSQEIDAAFQPVQARRAASQQKLDTLAQQAAARRQQGLTAGEIVTFTKPDGTTETWPADLAAEYERQQALDQEAEAQDAPLLEKLAAQHADLQAEAALQQEAGQSLQTRQRAQQDQVAETLESAAPGMGVEYRTLLADQDQRAEALRAQFQGREDSPEAKAAFKALSDDIAAKASLIEGVARDEAKKKTTALNSLWDKFNTYASDRDHLYDWTAKVSTDTDLANQARAKADAAYGQQTGQPGYSFRKELDAQFDTEAKALGIDPAEARVFMETRRRLDWSKPLTGEAVEAADSLTGPLLQRLGITEMQEPLRTLPDGTLIPNPALGSDETAFRAVIAKSTGTAEQKKAALALWPEYRRMYGETLLATFADQTAFGEDFNQWREENPMPSADPAEQALAYADKMKSRPAWRRWGDLVASNVTAGFMDITSAVLGTAGAASGLVSDTVSEGISSLAAANAANAGTLVNAQGELSNTGLAGAITGTIARMAPGVAATLATGSMAGAMTFGAMQTGGTLYSEAYGQLREQGMSHEDAWRSAAPASAAAGAMTAALTKVFPGGATAILQDNAARHSVRAMMAGFLASGKSVAKGALDEIPEELIDEGVSQLAQAQAEGRDPRSAVRDFITGLPEIIGAAGIVGGGMQAVSDYRDRRQQAPSSAPSNPANLPENVAAAETAIDSLQLPDVDEATLARTQDAARGVLYIAQGTPLTELDAETLAALDIVEDPQKPGTFVNGRIVPGKNGIPEVQTFDAGQAPVANPDGTAGMRPVRVRLIDGQPVISQATLDKLGQILPAVRAAIPLDEKQRLQQLTQPPAGGPAPANATQSPVQVSPANGPDSARGESPPAPAQPEPPVTAGSLEPAAQQRATELATLLEDRGLTAPQAAHAASKVIEAQGIVGASAEEQYAAGIDDELFKLGWVKPQTRKKYEFFGRSGTPPTSDAGTPARTAPADATDPFTVTPVTKVTPVTSPPAKATTDLADRVVVAKQRAMKAVPVASRKRFVKFVSPLTTQLARFQNAFPGGIVFTDGQAKDDLNYTGAGISVAEATTAPRLDVNLAELFKSADHLEEKDLAAFTRRAVMHEVRHLAALKVITPSQARALWKDLTPGLQARVYASYYAADLQNATGGKPLSQKQLLTLAQQAVSGVNPVNKVTLPKADPFHMAHEFLRMLDEDAEFAGQTSEAMDASPALGQAILDFLRSVLDEIKRLIATDLDQSTRVQLKEFQKLVEAARKQILADNPADRLGSTKEASVAPLTTAADTRASVLQGSVDTPVRTDFNPVRGSTGTAYTDSNDAIEFQWAVADVNSLNISNLDNGRINPDYPQELQPRDRTSAASEAQVNDIAKNFNLDRLSASSSVGDGAPIVGPDTVVESGNGRVMGARRAHRDAGTPARKYREALIARAGEFGLNAEQIEAVPNPVLIRIRTTEVNRTAFVLAANVSTIAPKREMEQAKIDSKQIVPDLFDAFVPAEDGEIFTAANADFIRGFVSAVIPPAERGQVIDASGNLSQSGLRRIRNALFVHAYGTSPEALNALGRLTESIDATDTALARSLLAMAPRFAEQNARIASGALYPFSITENLAQSLQKLADLRARGEKVETWLQQDRIPGIGDDPGPITTALVQFLHENRTRPRQVLDTLDRYAKALDSAGDPRQISLFGDEKPDAETLWKLAANYKQEPALAMGRKNVSGNAEKVDFSRDLLAAKIDQDRFVGPNWYYSTLKKLRKALAMGKSISIENRDVSDYGGTLGVIIDGEEMPLTRRKIPHRDMHFHFGVQRRQKVEEAPTVKSPTPGWMVVMPDDYDIVGYTPRSNNRFENQPIYSNGQTRITEEEALAQGIAKERLPYGPATTTGTASAYVERPTIAPASALKVYKKLTAQQKEKPLTAGQNRALEAAERSLGQLFLFDEPNRTLKPAEDLVLEQQTASRATFADSTPEQLRLFMATKKVLYSKAAKEKHLRPITRQLVKLRVSVQDALVRVVQETIIPKIPPRLRALMDQTAADYDAWLKPRMAALKPQWDAYKARFTPAIVEGYNKDLEDLASELGVMPMTRVPLKGDRGMEKAILDAADDSERLGTEIQPDVTKVNDVLRASLVAADDEGVARTVAALRARYKVVKFKDRFTKPVGGYHDWNFIIEVAPGLNAEVQVHRVDYLFSKEIGPGHLMYEDWRRLDRLVKLNPAPEIAQLYRRLSKTMEGYYTAIGQAFAISRNSTSSMISPSVNTLPESRIGKMPAGPATIGTGGSPSLSHTTGVPSTSKNSAVAGNESGIFTPDNTPETPSNQGIRITTANIDRYAGNVDVSALQGRQKDWRQAFDVPAKPQMVPLAKLVSPKNELESPRFKAGLKPDPRQTAANFIARAIAGEPGVKKRAPLDVSANPDGTYTIHDGNATAQALMLAGWKAVPVNEVNPVTLAKASTTLSPEYQAAWEDFTAEGSSSFDLFPAAWPLYQQQIQKEPEAAVQKRILDAYLQAMKAYGAITNTAPRPENFGYLWEDEKPFMEAIRGTVVGDPVAGSGNFLAKARTTPDTSPDLFGFNAGLGLDTLLTPRQKEAKITQSQQLDLFGGTPNDGSPSTRTQPGSQRREPTRRTSRTPAPPEQSQGPESLFGDLFSQRDDGQRISASRLPRKPGPRYKRTGSGDVGDGVSGPTDQGTTDKPADSPQGDPPGLSLAPALIPQPADPADRNHRITGTGTVAPKGNKAKLEANFAAMKLVRELDAAGRNPTPEEKQVLAAYTGWGWMKEAFNTVRARKYDDLKLRAERYIATKPRWDSRYFAKWQDFYADNATEEDRRILSWADTYLETHERLKTELSEKEFHAAEKSTLNAHFTTPSIIDAMWKAVAKLGFKGGRAMEPGGGIGHFIGVQPEDIANRTQWEATELDDVTARILARLYPQARVNSAMSAPNREVSGMGFQNARIPNNSLDLFISNVPFAKQGPGKAKSEFGQDFNLHNYFFARALSKVKPGGLIAFITTSNTMESSRAQRDYLNNHGQLVAAVRLPNNAFKENAGTEVTTDILILRKPDDSDFVGEPWRERIKVGEDTVTSKRQREGSNAQRIDDWLGSIDPEWIPADEALVEPFQAWMKGGRPASGQKRKALIDVLNRLHGFNPQKLDFRAPIYVNEYFARHPENVLGTNRLVGSMYGPGEYTVTPKDEALDSQLGKFVDRLPEDIMSQSATNDFEAKAAERGDKVDSYVEREGRIYQVTKEGLEPVEWQVMPGMDSKAKAAAERKTAIFRQWAKLRDAAVALVKLEANPLADESEMKNARLMLNQVYDRTVEKHGALSKRRNNNYRFLDDDPEAALLQALEDEERSTAKDGKVTYTYTKTDIFHRRLIEPQEAPTTAASLEEAVSISMAWEGTVNPQYVADLLGTDAGLARQQLIEGGHVFEDPSSGMLMTADEYLSGPVSERLRLAQEAVKDSPQYARNVTALREALPPHKAISEASVILGQRWVPDSIYTAFARFLGIEDGTVEFSKELNSFSVRGEGSNEEWNVGNQGAKDILDAVMNNMTLVYRRYVRGEGMQTDEELTATLRVKADEMRDAFSQFVKTTEEQVADPEFEGQTIPIPDIAEREFNQKVNGIKPPNFVGDWVKLPGQSGIIWLKPFRKAVLARLITQGRGMMAHGVGSGKTYNQIALAMELRRLGKARKPVIVVQNSTINQFAASFRKAYPQAKILVATPRSYNAQTRARFTARMATGDWDAIIMTHSNVDLIGHSAETVTAYFAKELEELDAAIMASDGSDQQSDLQKARDSLIEKRDEMMQALGERQDDTLNWEDIGVDALIVDEAHAFKNAPVVTNRGRDIKNIPSSGVGSQRAVSMMMKTRSVRERNGQKGVFFATGTPVSNSMAEAFIMLRYIAPDLLEANGIRNFDDFASQYGDVVSQAESTWDGKVKMVDRFAKFVNGQQLINLVRSVFDVAMGNESLGIDVPTVKGGKPRQIVVPATAANMSFNNWIVQSVSPSWERITRKDIEANPKLSAVPIMTMQAGIAAALDPRLIHDKAPDDPNSKVNTAIREVLRIYKAGTERKTAQVLFSDLFNSFNMDILEGFADHPFADLGENSIRKNAKLRDDGSPPRGNFNLGEDIKAKLIAAGVPEREIIVVTDQKDEALTNIFDKVNDGDIRIIIGSTGRLGVGVNIQERLAAVHHLMPPRDFKPAMMEQRNGRIIRQGNLHAEWRDIALVDVVERLGKTRFPTKDDKGKALSPSKRATAAKTWLAENDKDGSIKTAADTAAREFDIEIIEYGVEKSLDSAVYSMMAAKQGMIAQVLTADAVGNEFEDPSDEIRMNMAEMAAHTQGDPDMIRTVQVDKIFRELRAAYEGFQRMDSGRRADVRRLTHNITTDTAALPRIDSEAERYGKLWDANEGKPVYTFGGTTIDTAEKDAKITKPLDLWVTENAREMALKGQQERSAKFTINGQDFNLTVKGESEPTEFNDGGVYGFVEIAKSDRYANFQGGARGVLQALHRLTEATATRPVETRAEIAKNSKKLAQIESYLAKEQGFPRMEELQAIQRERLELQQRINARNAPAPKPPSDNTVRQGLVIPPLTQADAVLLTPEVNAALAQAVITDNSLVLPEQLDRKLYEKVNRALESAGGVWSKRDKAHLFAGDPRPYLGLAEMPEDATLAKASTQVYTPTSYDTAAPDPFTGFPSLITGSQLSREQGRAISHAHAQRLRAGLSSRPDNGQAGPALAASRAGTLSVKSDAGTPARNLPPVPVLSNSQFAKLQKLPLIGEGAEAKVYADRTRGVVYKVLQGYAPVPGVIGSTALGVWPQVYYTSSGKLDYAFAPAERPRQLAVRLAVQTLLGGTPTEIVGIAPEGHIILKQPLSPNPSIGSESAPPASSSSSFSYSSSTVFDARNRAGLVEIPKALLADPNAPRTFLAVVEGRPWLLMDLHPDNFVGDNQAQGRINDAIVGQLTATHLAKIPGLAQLVKDAAARARDLGDRADRLFMATKRVESPMASDSGAAQSNTEPSPGGLSEAEVLFRRLSGKYNEEIDPLPQSDFDPDQLSKTVQFAGREWEIEISNWAFRAWDKADADNNYTAHLNNELEIISDNEEGDVPEHIADIWEKAPESWWEVPTVDESDPTTWAPEQSSYAVQTNDGESGWQDDIQTLNLKEAVAAYTSEKSEDKRLIFYTGETTQGKDRFGFWGDMPQMEVLARPSFVAKLLNVFPGMTREEAQDIAASRNDDNTDAWLVAQAYARHRYTDYDDRLRAAREMDQDTSAERAKARFELRDTIESVMDRWSTPPTKTATPVSQSDGLNQIGNDVTARLAASEPMPEAQRVVGTWPTKSDPSTAKVNPESSRAADGTLAKATTTVTPVSLPARAATYVGKKLLDTAEGTMNLTSAATRATGLENPLQKLGWNHLDRALSAKLAALARWTDGRTGASQTVAKWTNATPQKLRDAAHALKREFFPDSVLPREILAKKREMEIKTAMGSQKAMDLVRALQGSPKFSTLAYPPGFAENPTHRRHLYEAMTGERDLATLPKELQDLAAKLRAMLVEIGREAVKQNRMSTDTFDNLRTTYMPHFYEEDVQKEKSLFQRFRLGVRDILAQRTTAWHIEDTAQKDSTGQPRLVSHTGNQWRFRNQQHMDAFFEDFIQQQALAELQSRYGKKFRSLTAADLMTPSKLDPEIRGRLQEIKRTLHQRYKRQRPLTIAEQEKAGLIMDPVYAIARYAAQMAHDNSTAEFFNHVAAQPALVSDIATPGFTEIPDNPRFGRLAGKFVENDVAGQLLELIETPGIALKIYDTVLGWWKTGKTVLNPGTHVRNVLGNLFFSQLAGNSVWNPGNATYYRQALTALRQGGPVLTEAYDAGVLGADFVSAELRQTLRQLLPDPATIVDDGKAPTFLMGIGKAIGRFIGTPAGKAYNNIAALYQAEDEIFKLAAYLKAKDMLTEGGAGTPARSAAAANHVRQWFPYFDSGTSGTLRLIGRTAMPFLGFYRESIRIFGHALKERPIALAAGLSVPSFVTFLSAMALGLDDDDLEEIQKDMRGKAGKLLGPTPLEGMPLFSMLLPVRSDTGQVQQFDISAVHPFVDFLGTRVESGPQEDWWQKTLRSFVAAGPIGSLLYAQMTGRDTFGDRTFVEDNMTGTEKLAARLDNAAKTLLPPLFPGGTGFETLSNAGERSTNKTLEVRSPTQAAVRVLGGLDVRNATPDLYRLADDWRKAHGYEVQEGMDYGSTTPASRARKALFAQLAQDQPNLTAVKNILTALDKMGHPVRTEQDVNKLLFYRDPLKLIGGNKSKGITAPDAQAQFRASLQGEARAALDNALQEYQRIKATAPSILARARQ